jgi:hypothetical protein
VSGKNACRFSMPRELVPTSHIDDFGLIHLARNHAWINPWNPAIASCVRSNQDISWIPTVSKSLSLIYYITNYATKDDVSPWQVVAKAALLRQSIEKAKVAEPPTATDLRLRHKGMGSFALRCFNALSQARCSSYPPTTRLTPTLPASTSGGSGVMSAQQFGQITLQVVAVPTSWQTNLAHTKVATPSP